MTTPTHPLRTMEEVLEAAVIEVTASLPGGPALVKRTDVIVMLDALRSRIAPPDPRHEGLRERVRRWLAWREDPAPTEGSPGSLTALLRDCLTALSPAHPQPGDVEWMVARLREEKRTLYIPDRDPTADPAYDTGWNAGIERASRLMLSCRPIVCNAAGKLGQRDPFYTEEAELLTGLCLLDIRKERADAE